MNCKLLPVFPTVNVVLRQMEKATDLQIASLFWNVLWSTFIYWTFKFWNLIFLLKLLRHLFPENSQRVKCVSLHLE